MTALAPPEIVPFRVPLLGGKYLLGDCIGAGGMGRVYRAHQPELDRIVAIKILHRALADDPHVARHFRTEAIAAARFSHPNSVAVIDYGETDEGVPFLVMEYLHGRTLSQIVRDEAPLDVRRAVTITAQILDALGDAHALGIVHADVKSDNVLVHHTRDRGEQAKLVDFGLARIAAAPDADGAHGDNAFISGTPAYMAPEVIRGGAPSPLSDGYSVGAMLYELLTGATPFGGADFDEILRRHLEDLVVPPSLRCPELAIPRHVEEATLRALAKDPAQRFPSTAAFAAALLAQEAPVSPRTRRSTATRGPGDAITTLVLPTASDERHAYQGVDPRRALAAAELEARHAVGAAIIAGEPERIVERYLELARLLRAGGHARGAVSELEEALDLLCGGDWPCPCGAATANLLVALLPLYIELGDRGAAARTRDRLDRSTTLTMGRP